ncbi:thiamine diphosphokinase [Paenibacillus sediminis]|uniref:Thiamine diphosphokinase n=1 Tax=Paenibacillus sediminis TaxID=664909 RepID=A0ABS4H0A3_9BACL|nr:thiamine diphosphokinase [Paenibacillus sediminis]MBP1935921.1 thiamine pyrophosphokinase [Paenibacillus sediminis]
MSSKRILIFTGGELSPLFLHEIKQEDYIIGADKGALFLIENGISPHVSVGDFDSVGIEDLKLIQEKSIKTITCDPIDKDLTDTELAFNIALSREPDEIILLGATGTRLDHTLANIQMMIRALQKNIRPSIVDAHNWITLTDNIITIEKRGYTYVSLLPITSTVKGVTLSGFMYPLDHATLMLGESLGISNQLIHESGTISIEEGQLLVIQSHD